MARRSNEQVQKILSLSSSSTKDNGRAQKQEQEELLILNKIALATEGFATKGYQALLSDRTRLSKENALTVCDYIIAMKREVNPRLLQKIHYGFSGRAIKGCWSGKAISRHDSGGRCLLSGQPENEDPLHKWIGSYNTKLVVLSRFFKWLHYPNVDNSKRRNELSASDRKPDCIIGISQLKRKEVSCYKPCDLWTQEDDQVFLKWVTNKRDRCYHTMARDLSARPHEILNLKIKDVLNFKAAGNTQYAEVLVNGKTGSRHIPLIQSIPYIKEWLSDHPSRNNRILSLSVLVRILWVGRLTLVDYIKVIETIKKSSFQSFIYITLSHLPFEQV